MVSACVLLQGCIKEDGGKVEEKEYETPLMMARRQGEEIMEYVVNKDKEGLKSMFSEYVSETHDLDKEIDEFFMFIDGEIISYDKPEGDQSGAVYSTKKSEHIKRLEGKIKNIKTDKGKTYSVGFSSYYIYNSNKDKVGIDIIGINDEDTWKDEGTYVTVEQCSIGGSE